MGLMLSRNICQSFMMISGGGCNLEIEAALLEGVMPNRKSVDSSTTEAASSSSSEYSMASFGLN